MIRRSRDIFAAALALNAATALGQDAASTSPADKSRYTLLDPTPAELMREMQTDRPNITNTPTTIDAGHYQLEAGLLDYSYFHHHTDGKALNADGLAFGQLNLRVGVLNNIELNAAINAYETIRTHDAADGTDENSSFGDTVLGGKINLWGNEGGDDVWATAFAIQPQLTFPTATREVGNGHFEGSIGFPFTINLPAQFHLSYQPGISYERNSAGVGDVVGFENAVSLDRETIQKLDVYVEYASDVTTEKHAKPTQSLDVGGIYQLTENMSLDAGVNFGLNDQTDNLEFVIGTSVRF